MEAIRRPTQLRGPKPKGRNTNGLLGFKALTFSFVCSDRSQRSDVVLLEDELDVRLNVKKNTSSSQYPEKRKPNKTNKNDVNTSPAVNSFSRENFTILSAVS
uniref:Uncharacterized protein n=1 Tax=Glossina palpalis gambiensis TaxID=67801 RepID=A0A1B0BG80_9MUSC